MLNTSKLFLSAAALAVGGLVVMVSGCNSSGDSSNGMSSLTSSSHTRVPADPAPAATDTNASASGNAIWGGTTQEDGTAMTEAEVAADIAAVPTLGVNYKQLQAAVTVDSASGIVTLYDANGNVIASIPASGFETIRSTTTTASSVDAKGNCVNGSVLFDLNDTIAGSPASQDKTGKTPAVAPVYAGFHVMLSLVCIQPAQQPAQQQPSQQPSPQPKQQPAQQPSPTPSPTQSNPKK